ncbi:hypothetical protein D2L64_02295 [Micromonospora radicis]|uniref:Uncharacterized protein n=1 Tax=Micromonospora radicis TaxID=1894971 RepID=A0A418N1A1_9ACTN|nr:hypothetical protein D2L64_02295 [Micromonospora radicis]
MPQHRDGAHQGATNNTMITAPISCHRAAFNGVVASPVAATGRGLSPTRVGDGTAHGEAWASGGHACVVSTGDDRD